jgi:Tfp pilus assembly protein PilO
MNKELKNVLIRLAIMDNVTLVLVSAVLAGIFYYFSSSTTDDLQRRLDGLKRDFGTETAQSAASDRALKQLELIRASVATLKERFEEASRQLPSDIRSTDLLRMMSDDSSKAGVFIRANEPKPSIRTEIVEEIPLHVSGTGTYSEITKFFFLVAKREKLAKVPNFVLHTLERRDKNDKPDKPGALGFEADIYSYRFAGDEPLPGTNSTPEVKR